MQLFEKLTVNANCPLNSNVAKKNEIVNINYER